VESISTLTDVALAMSVVTSLPIMALNSVSAQGMFSLFNAIQLFLLLPLVGTNVSSDVICFLTSMKFSLVSMKFMPSENINDMIPMVGSEQTDPYLSLIDLDNSSAFMNLIDTMQVLLIFTIVLLCL